jgi:hypothetical protein
MLRLAGALALAVATTGCDGGDGGAGQTRSIKPSNPFVEQLKSLSEANRGLGLRRAVQDSKQRCKKAEASAYQQDYKNLSMWTLRCSDGEYAIFIAPSGDVQVRSCKDVKTLGLPECRLPPAKSG